MTHINRLRAEARRDVLRPTLENVCDALVDVKIPKWRLRREEDTRGYLQAALQRRFHTVQKDFSIGGTYSDKIDLDIDGTIGLEIKLFASLRRLSNAQRLLGQLRYYRRRYGNNLVVVIAGARDEDLEDTRLEDLQDEIMELDALPQLV